jgi:anti-sigma regulatory factor (Ser/Thr protein kinase)
MTRSAPVDCEMRTALPASLRAIEDFFKEFRLKHKTVLSRVNCFAAELLLREALTNAVVHGCHSDPSKEVRCVLRLKGRRLLITVQDDGDGFNWREAWSSSAELSDCSGRGMEILRKYANHIRYNDRGNVVAIVKRLCR